MFRKREKKSYPPGTFIPMPARICSIIQLCLAFTIILWNLGQPFAGDLFSAKSKLILYQDVMGTNSHQEQLSTEKQVRLQRNAQRFAGLTDAEKSVILKGLVQVQIKLQRSFLDKMKSAMHILFFEIPIFEQAWLILSLLIPIMLLKRVEGAVQAVWLLPLLAGLYAFDNRWHGHIPRPTEDILLFPTEQVLVEKFLGEPFSANVFEQREQLQGAWRRYLIEVWGGQSPRNQSKDELHAEKGEFAFNLARLQLIAKDNSKSLTRGMQEPLVILGFYIFWNALFAAVVWKRGVAIS